LRDPHPDDVAPGSDHGGDRDRHRPHPRVEAERRGARPAQGGGGAAGLPDGGVRELAHVADLAVVGCAGQGRIARGAGTSASRGLAAVVFREREPCCVEPSSKLAERELPRAAPPDREHRSRDAASIGLTPRGGIPSAVSLARNSDAFVLRSEGPEYPLECKPERFCEPLAANRVQSTTSYPPAS